MDTITNETKLELKQMIINTLDYFEGDIGDLHHEVFNTDYFIIGTYKAKIWIEENYGVFEAIEKIKTYEQDNFGEVFTDLSNPEHVCNMLVYILGEEIMQEIDAISDNWGEDMTEDIKQAILEELKGED